MTDHPADGPAPDSATPDYPGWPAEAAQRYRDAGYWEGRTIDAYLETWARDRPDRPALIAGERAWTYAELHAAATERARGLSALGVAEGDRVVVHLPNCAEYALMWFALQCLGAVPVHTMPAHRSAEVRDLIRTSGATAYLIPDRHQRFDYRPMAAELLASEPCLRHVVVHGDAGDYRGFTTVGALARCGTSLPQRGAADPSGLAALLLSGGTTGRPKLIPRTHDDYAYNARAAAAACNLTERSVYLAVLPMGFNFALACPGMLGTLMAGGTVVVAPDPSAGTAFALIERHGVTITAISPALVPYWLDEHARAPDALRSLLVLQVGGARLPDASAERLDRELRVTVQQVFGMAEGLVCVTRLDDTPELMRTTQGRPLSPADEILIVDGQGRDVPDGQPGELLTRGPYTLRGYYRAPEHNARSFTPEGFYATGDIVRRLPSGHLVVTGRSKDQINRGGEKIAAAEVEEHLAAHPGVKAAALVAAPDERWGERSVAYLVVSTQPPPTRRALADFLRARGLSAHKAPDEVVAVDALPLTPVGKVDKQALRARLWN